MSVESGGWIIQIWSRSKYQQWRVNNLLSFRKAAARVDPTALTRLSKGLNHPSSSYNNTAGLPPNNWTFNKTLSNLIRQTSRSAPLSRLTRHSAESFTCTVRFSPFAERTFWGFSTRRGTSLFWRARWNQELSSTTCLTPTAPLTSQKIYIVFCRLHLPWRTNITGAAPLWETLGFCWTAAVDPTSTLTTLLSGILFFLLRNVKSVITGLESFQIKTRESNCTVEINEHFSRSFRFFSLYWV